MTPDSYQNPLVQRYASAQMSQLWGSQKKFATWRRMWIALAEAEQELGLRISNEQIAQLRANVDKLNLDVARKYERELRHDVMAHVHAYGDQCPDAREIIHLGATSCFVTDNTDLILLRKGLQLVRDSLVATIDALATFAEEHRSLACLGFTHLQPAQPTTIGKRASLWLLDLVMDLEDLEGRIAGLRARSTKGTTGTQASFMKLFDGDEHKVRELEKIVAKKLGFEQTYAVTGQTYPRKVDCQVLDTLSGIAQSAHKAATDLRIMSSRKEIDEPFEEKQIGSSAMAYKRNPMRSERICALARYVISLPTNAAQTLATQWMERTLDDSANRRLVLPQAFLAIDAILALYQNVASGLVVYPKVIDRHLREELPFMASENIMMEAVAQGGDRQELHELIRQHSQEAGRTVKQEGQPNDLLDRLKADQAFAGVNLEAAMDTSQYVGRAPSQVTDMIREVIDPIRRNYPDALKKQGEVRV